MTTQTCLSRAEKTTLHISTRASDPKVEAAISDLLGIADELRECNQYLLSYFAEDIRSIAEEVLYGPEYKNKGECVLLDIARNCYKQATAPNGLLHYNRYTQHLNNPTNSTKDSLPHQNQQAQLNWESFWSTILLHTPGPILFTPSINPLFSTYDFQLTSMPRYLFRTFDTKSFGLSNSSVISSPASQLDLPSSNFDIFDPSIDTSISAAMVNRHMNPWRVKDYENHDPDNFMSWTSSLLYAVQYAFYRRHHYHQQGQGNGQGCAGDDGGDIRICVLDTTRFPLGQFIHAKKLLQGFYERVIGPERMREVFDMRLLVYIYQNGEYLSQGTLHRGGQGQSCVVSLKQLEQAGLYKIYPEFGITEGHSQWAVTTARFRKEWLERDTLTSWDEIEIALGLARCFGGLDVLDMAVVLLCFKRRLLRANGHQHNQDLALGFSGNVSDWARKPQEVRHSLAALQVLRSIRKSVSGPARRAEDGTEEDMMRALLDCFRVLPS